MNVSCFMLFKIPGVRTVTLKTGCVDAGRATANRCLRQGRAYSVSGGPGQQLGRLWAGARLPEVAQGFVRLAMIHNVPLVPAYCLGPRTCSGPTAPFSGRWLVRNLSPTCYSGVGASFAPTPKSSLQVPQDMFGGRTPPHIEDARDVDKAHAVFVEDLAAMRTNQIRRTGS